MPRPIHKAFRWSRATIQRELGHDARTIGKRLAAANLDSKLKFNSREVFAAMVGDVTAERTRLYAAQADKAELDNAQKRAELVPAADFGQILAKALESIKAVIMAEANVEREDKDKQLAAVRTALESLESRLGWVPADPESAPETDGD